MLRVSFTQAASFFYSTYEFLLYWLRVSFIPDTSFFYAKSCFSLSNNLVIAVKKSRSSHQTIS